MKKKKKSTTQRIKKKTKTPKILLVVKNCPVCGMDFDERHCRLVCPRCGASVDCSDPI